MSIYDRGIPKKTELQLMKCLIHKKAIKQIKVLFRGRSIGLTQFN